MPGSRDRDAVKRLSSDYDKAAGLRLGRAKSFCYCELIATKAVCLV